MNNLRLLAKKVNQSLTERKLQDRLKVNVSKRTLNIYLLSGQPRVTTRLMIYQGKYTSNKLTMSPNQILNLAEVELLMTLIENNR